MTLLISLFLIGGLWFGWHLDAYPTSYFLTGTAAIAAFDIFAIFPYQLWKANKVDIDKLKDRLKPKIDVFLDTTCSGIRIVENLLSGDTPQRGPDSKWVQIMVRPATDVSLINCETRLIGAERINENDTIEPIMSEPVFCTWSEQSQESEKKHMNIPAKISQAANIFSIHQNDNSLSVETLPVKFGFRDKIQKASKYRLKIAVSANDVPTEIRSFVFEWGEDYNKISINQE